MNKLYFSFLALLFLVSTGLSAQRTSGDLANDDRVADDCLTTMADLLDEVPTVSGLYEQNSEVVICGRIMGDENGDFNVSADRGVIDSVLIYYATPDGFRVNSASGRVRGGSYTLFPDTNYAIVIAFGAPVDEGDFNVELVVPLGGGTSSGEGTVEGDPALPVTLTSFTGAADKKAVNLDWTTSYELDNEGFEVQRSNNGEEWNAINFVAGNAIDGIYSTEDLAPLSGTSYYRLKQMDYDGRFAFSPTIEVSYAPEVQMSIFPNPTQDVLNLRLAEGLVNSTAIVTDQAGRRVIERQVLANTRLDVSTLSQGIYQVSVITPEGPITQRFFKQ